MQESPSGDVAATEIRIVSQLRSLSIRAGDAHMEKKKKEKILAEMNSMLAELGIDFKRVALVIGNSIVCYLVCFSEKELQQLWRHYVSGHMKLVLESVFSILTNGEENIVIRQLRWNYDEYCRQALRLNGLNAVGW